MKLLTVDEVLKLWRCHRVTIFRLMTRGTLDWVEVDGEPLFDEAEVLRLKNPGIAIFPHLTISRGESHKPARVRMPLDQLVWRYKRIDEKFEQLTERARWLAAESELCVARWQRVRGDFERARDESRVGLNCGRIDVLCSFPTSQAIPASAEILPPPL